MALTERNKLFIRDYVKSGCKNMTGSYMKIYDTKGRRRSADEASRILKSEKGREYMQSLIQPAEDETIATLNECLHILTDIMRDEKSTKAEKLKAIDMRLKTLGAYMDKVQVSADNQINIKIDTGDTDEC